MSCCGPPFPFIIDHLGEQLSRTVKWQLPRAAAHRKRLDVLVPGKVGTVFISVFSLHRYPNGQEAGGGGGAPEKNSRVGRVGDGWCPTGGSGMAPGGGVRYGFLMHSRRGGGVRYGFLMHSRRVLLR